MKDKLLGAVFFVLLCVVMLVASHSRSELRRECFAAGKSVGGADQRISSAHFNQVDPMLNDLKIANQAAPDFCK
jgi:hypothetical protein